MPSGSPSTFLVAPGLYGTVWMSSLLCLAHAASVTRRIRLATGLLILPYYHPVRLAREIQALVASLGERFVLGVGALLASADSLAGRWKKEEGKKALSDQGSRRSRGEGEHLDRDDERATSTVGASCWGIGRVSLRLASQTACGVYRYTRSN